jgi:amidase
MRQGYLSLSLLLGLLFLTCQTSKSTLDTTWEPYDQSALLAENADHESRRMRYKLIQSRVRDKNAIWADLGSQLRGFSQADYERLKPLIYEQDIPTLQEHVAAGRLSYEELAQWYLYRIVLFENDRDKTLNGIISINPGAVAAAREKDRQRSGGEHPIYGIPILLKDNINTTGMATTAGAHALLNNRADDAFITARIKEKGGIILGKANLSEWANYLCRVCPNGYSAVGGQTLNAYGRRKLDTGGSSSGSGVSMAANYAAAAVGTETSGSILSPSSASSLVGLKPTIGLLSRGGIVPISSTLDTPGPMTRTVVDNAILLSAMTGEDPRDPATRDNPKGVEYWQNLTDATLEGKRFGVLSNLANEAVYQTALGRLRQLGAEIVEVEPVEVDFSNFLTLLDADMKRDMPAYLTNYAGPDIPFRSMEDLVEHNAQDTLIRIPYGQYRFTEIVADETSDDSLAVVRDFLKAEGVRFFETHFQDHDLDAILSINNYNAGQAAVAQYPALTVPMGYADDGEPRGLTFIGRPFTEDALLRMGYAFERATRKRVPPAGY